MAQQRLNHTPKGKMLVFTDHIAYEIKMLRMTYRLLGLPAFSAWVGNALIESFSIHARALLEFFEEATPESEEQVCACHFTDGGYSPFVNGKLDPRLRGKLHAQIAHLSYQRTADDKDKLNAEDRKVLLQFLNREIEHFSTHLRSPYKEQWSPDLRVEIIATPTLQAQDSTSSMVTLDTCQFTLTPDTAVSSVTSPAAPPGLRAADGRRPE